MAYVELAAAPVNGCYLVKCDSCGKTTWKVRVSFYLLFFYLPLSLYHSLAFFSYHPCLFFLVTSLYATRECTRPLSHYLLPSSRSFISTPFRFSYSPKSPNFISSYRRRHTTQPSHLSSHSSHTIFHISCSSSHQISLLPSHIFAYPLIISPPRFHPSLHFIRAPASHPIPSLDSRLPTLPHGSLCHLTSSQR